MPATDMTPGEKVASNLHACQIISGRDKERVAKQIDAEIEVARKAPIPELDLTFPVVAYFGTSAERDEFIAVMQSIKPGMKQMKL